MSDTIDEHDRDDAKSEGIFDPCREDAGHWRFTRRHFNLYYFGPPDLSTDIYDGELEYSPPPGMPGAHDPTPVRR